jgi:hypothetical protein
MLELRGAAVITAAWPTVFADAAGKLAVEALPALGL